MTPKLLRILREIAIFAFILWVGSTAMSWWRAPKLDSATLPRITGTLIDGTPFDSDTLRGKPILIEFWGTWCPVCKQQAPNISRIAKRYNVLTIAVNSRDKGHIRKWMAEEGVDYPVLNDLSGHWAKQFKVSVYPTTYIYNAQRKLKFTDVGYTTTAGMLARMKMAE
jgi:thiol-disulfide isomerase/thioredoxin